MEQTDLDLSETPEWFKAAACTARKLVDAWGWEGISEASALAHIVVPMLRDLGWRREQIRLEYDWVDIAVFGEKQDVPVLLIEGKAPKFGVSAARRQAFRYRRHGEKKKGWREGQIPVLATNGFSMVMALREDRIGSEAFLLKPTTKAKDFFAAMEQLTPAGQEKG